MSKKEVKYSEAGKGDKRRGNQSKYAKNWDKIFGKASQGPTYIEDGRPLKEPHIPSKKSDKQDT